MTEERAALDPIEEIGRLISKIDELEKSLSSRVVRRPTGDFEITLRKTPKADTIFLQGQTLQRADYPALWQWVQDQDLTTENFFGTGNGSTTFQVPDFRGRFLIGTGQLSSDTYTLGRAGGSSTKVILPTNMASHTHQVGISNHTIDVGSDEVSHTHFTSMGGGDHGGHRPGEAPGSAGTTARWPTIALGSGAHGHSAWSGNANAPHQHYSYVSPHSVSQVTVGNNTPMDIRPPYIPVNYMMWV